jgi:small subunit ribosomal protein S15
MLEKKAKDKIIAKFASHPGDTGSSQVQIAILTQEINDLVKHLKNHKKDFSSRRGLLQKVNLRRKLLNYLEREEPKKYKKLVEALKLKR